MNTFLRRRSREAVREELTFSKKAVERDDARGDISERLGSLIDLGDLTGPIEIEVESDDDELEMVCEDLEID